ncbi:hypothetical protein NDU88_004977 [Pleurodeles waltl]|uniref:Uncharacterized protein n=1 Tax=Pleurodeles waltl TaxID=8319 RepID=A0AAV7TTH0_PLEWA|nr:hypothetical protein NDU88_004977 [Pleurodeles waltl]
MVAVGTEGGGEALPQLNVRGQRPEEDSGIGASDAPAGEIYGAPSLFSWRGSGLRSGEIVFPPPQFLITSATRRSLGSAVPHSWVRIGTRGRRLDRRWGARGHSAPQAPHRNTWRTAETPGAPPPNALGSEVVLSQQDKAKSDWGGSPPPPVLLDAVGDPAPWRPRGPGVPWRCAGRGPVTRTWKGAGGRPLLQRRPSRGRSLTRWPGEEDTPCGLDRTGDPLGPGGGDLEHNGFYGLGEQPGALPQSRRLVPWRC